MAVPVKLPFLRSIRTELLQPLLQLARKVNDRARRMKRRVPATVSVFLISASILISAAFLIQVRSRSASLTNRKMHVITPSACLKCHSDQATIKAMDEKRGDLVIYSSKKQGSGKCPYIDVR